MCNFSTQAKKSRPAKEGENLVVHQNKNSTYTAFRMLMSAGGDCDTAVCLRNGTKLTVVGLPLPLQSELGVGFEAEAVFVERRENENSHPYDLIRFPTGKELFFGNLPVGTGIVVREVLTPSSPQEVPEEILVPVRAR